MSSDKKEPASSKKKLSSGDIVTVERDYSKGIAVRFDTTLPDSLKDLVCTLRRCKLMQQMSSDEFSDAIKNINEYFEGCTPSHLL